MSEAIVPLAMGMDPLVDMARARLSSCPAGAQTDLLACLTYLRYARGERDEKATDVTAMDQHYSRAISMESRGLEPREDRALTLMVMAITAMRDNTPSSNARAERTLRQIRIGVDV
jgi:hypothetical protein